jgi:hypothetical protein
VFSEFGGKYEMKYSGSIVIKRTRLLDLSDTLKFIWRSNIDDDARWNIFGQQITLDRIMEEEFCEPGLRDWAQYNWYDPCQHFGEFINHSSGESTNDLC